MLNQTKRLLAAASIAVAAAAIALTGTAEGMASPHPSSSTTLRLRVHGGSLSVVNVANSAGFPKTGDELILVQPIYAAAHPRTVIGHGYLTLTFVTKTTAPPAGLRDSVTLVLKRGDIELSGVGTGNPFTLAVTGGTGIYRSARGQATVTSGPGKDNPASVTVTLLP